MTILGKFGHDNDQGFDEQYFEYQYSGMVNILKEDHMMNKEKSARVRKSVE